MKTYKLTGIPDDNFGVYLDILYSDGTALYGQVLACPTDTHDWVYSDTVFRLDSSKSLASVNVTLLLREHTGAVWFDNVYLVPVTQVTPYLIDSTHNFHVGIFGAARVWALNTNNKLGLTVTGNNRVLFSANGVCTI
jgi:hypothetical protein